MILLSRQVPIILTCLYYFGLDVVPRLQVRIAAEGATRGRTASDSSHSISHSRLPQVCGSLLLRLIPSFVKVMSRSSYGECVRRAHVLQLLSVAETQVHFSKDFFFNVVQFFHRVQATVLHGAR